MVIVKPLPQNFLWAQDKKNIFVKIDVADVFIKDLKIQLTREDLVSVPLHEANNSPLFNRKDGVFFRQKKNLDWPKEHKVLFLLVSTYNTFTIQYCVFPPLKKKKRGPKKKTSYKIDWKSSRTNMTATKKELYMNNNQYWKNTKPRLMPKEWDELSEYGDIYAFPDNLKKKKIKIKKMEMKRKRKNKKRIAAITENEKSQPRQISENKRGHFPKKKFFFFLLHQTDMHLWMTHISPKKKKKLLLCHVHKVSDHFVFFFLTGGKTKKGTIREKKKSFFLTVMNIDKKIKAATTLDLVLLKNL
ncbi:hypothetical protein RFI_01781 [Reticulomyxa filosa]|uniref:CS domain-containing protein n=1 Tax=Reticulomyxa filosa TaxID=46433 RepID=X6PC87_RETFI|nr:hypothetical protein RFI_01781 [Reticulomyxa filosa]|eukprot:ETO35282.1 hypothetical protein RFI_01781 [Reticulomyxa filosa]